jgi:hypothetical protein
MTRPEEVAVFRFRAALTIALLLVISLTSFGPAAAGGPTSALLTVPGEGETASLYYTDPEYDALARLVEINSTDTSMGGVDQSGRGHERGPGVTVTWLIHDVSPWRVDHIYPEGEGAPWIATQLAVEGDTIWDSPVVWHQPESGDELLALLDKLGVGEAARSAESFSGVAGAPVAASAGSASDQPAPAEQSGASGIWWALCGLIAGVLATLLVTRFRRNKVPDTAGRASRAPEDDDTGPAIGEELSWPPPRQ